MSKPDIVFVFGSNLAGRHGKGAAYYAMKHFGAEYGVGVGRTGNAYAIPTKDANLRVLSWEAVSVHIKEFFRYAKENPDTFFIFTAIGTGLAGFTIEEACYWLMEYYVPDNVYVSGKLVNEMEFSKE